MMRRSPPSGMAEMMRQPSFAAASAMSRPCCVESFSRAGKRWKCLGMCCTMLQG